MYMAMVSFRSSHNSWLWLCLFCFCGYFCAAAGGDVCSCRQDTPYYECSPCVSPGFCSKINVALGKTANASSLYYNSGYNEMSGPACLAVNGNTGTTFKPINQFPSAPACVHTADGDPAPYWEVDLGQQYIISSITVYGRQELYRNMITNAVVSVDDKPCYTFRSGNSFKVDITCNPPLTGRNVKIQKKNDPDLPFLAVCQVQVWGCNRGFYGSDCTNTCGNCLAGTCEPSSGLCPQGCVAGYQAPYCKYRCESGFYGSDCTNTCGNCLASVCDPSSGVCPQGCVAGYQAPYCKDRCNSGFYGADCTNTCGNCSTGTCEPSSGICPQGCVAGYQARYCKDTCADKTYGMGCNDTCGNCAVNAKCNVYNGSCETGCAAGYRSPLCKDVCNGSYGPDCTFACGNCIDETTCNPRSGECPYGCKAGYRGTYCNETCFSGKYGARCQQQCGYCKDNATCHYLTGICLNGCEDGYMGLACSQNCTDGHFGANCTHECGRCANKSSCNAKTGYCLGGCESGRQGNLCNETIPDKVVNIPAIAGSVSVISVILIALIAVIGIFKFRRRRQGKRDANTSAFTTRHENSKNQNTDEMPSFDVVSSQNLTAEYLNTSEATVVIRKDLEKMKPKIAVKPSLGNPSASHGPYENIYVNVEGDISQTVHSRAKRESVDLLPDLEDETDSTYRNAESIYATFKASRPELDNVQQSLVDILASGELTDQFEKLPKGLTDEHGIAMLPENIKKNRYYSVLPYDKNRVILTDGYSTGKATDYINASYITGFRHEKTYIAAQGPRDNTSSDFWRMIWQEHASQIVMLTGLIEAGKNKCFEYWPPLNMSETHGPVTVTAVEVQRRADFLIRKFVIKKAGTSEERKVEQFHYLAWPDHGVPSVSSLLNFWRFAKSRGPSHPPPPVLVHCTAGVGRTGTYIGLDIAYEHAIDRKEVNVFEIVVRLRQERCAMIQAVEQYEILHEIVLEAYTAKDTLIPVDLFTKIFDKPISISKENKRIDEEFQSAIQMRSVRKPLGTDTAKQPVNKDKIRNRNSIPADNHLVYLTAYVPTRNQFINAVYMPTYRECRGHVMTQLPLQETLVDFWRLVDGCDVKMLVSLGSGIEQETVNDFCQYWPKDAGTSVVTGPYMLRHKATHSLGNNLTSYLMIMEKRDQSPREVQLLHYRDWAGELPGNISEFLQFVETLERIRLKEHKSSPVVIQCLDGVAKCGLFCTLFNIVSRLTCDREVDVYMVVREVHSVSPQAIASLAQYKYCYQVAQQRVSDLNIYANA